MEFPGGKKISHHGGNFFNRGPLGPERVLGNSLWARGKEISPAGFKFPGAFGGQKGGILGRGKGEKLWGFWEFFGTFWKKGPPRVFGRPLSLSRKELPFGFYPNLKGGPGFLPKFGNLFWANFGRWAWAGKRGANFPPKGNTFFPRVGVSKPPFGGPRDWPNFFPGEGRQSHFGGFPRRGFFPGAQRIWPLEETFFWARGF